MAATGIQYYHQSLKSGTFLGYWALQITFAEDTFGSRWMVGQNFKKMFLDILRIFVFFSGGKGWKKLLQIFSKCPDTKKELKTFFDAPKLQCPNQKVSSAGVVWSVLPISTVFVQFFLQIKYGSKNTYTYQQFGQCPKFHKFLKALLIPNSVILLVLVHVNFSDVWFFIHMQIRVVEEFGV